MRGEREPHLITAGLEHTVCVPSRRCQPRPARRSCVAIRGQSRERGRVRERSRDGGSVHHLTSVVAINGARRQGSITDVTANEPSQSLFWSCSAPQPFVFVSKSSPFFPILTPFVKTYYRYTFVMFLLKIILSTGIGVVMERLELLMLWLHLQCSRGSCYHRLGPNSMLFRSILFQPFSPFSLALRTRFLRSVRTKL
ncbi:uncharacterized protein DS421_11g327440 [Arachis hypogaea]|nr:uncharacterized protein DS421_11g327440 [Arachis hypogaea]